MHRLENPAFLQHKSLNDEWTKEWSKQMKEPFIERLTSEIGRHGETMDGIGVVEEAIPHRRWPHTTLRKRWRMDTRMARASHRDMVVVGSLCETIKSWWAEEGRGRRSLKDKFLPSLQTNRFSSFVSNIQKPAKPKMECYRLKAPRCQVQLQQTHSNMASFKQSSRKHKIRTVSLELSCTCVGPNRSLSITRRFSAALYHLGKQVIPKIPFLLPLAITAISQS